MHKQKDSFDGHIALKFVGIHIICVVMAKDVNLFHTSYGCMIDNSIAYLDEVALKIRRSESGRQPVLQSTQSQFKVTSKGISMHYVYYCYLLYVDKSKSTWLQSKIRW